MKRMIAVLMLLFLLCLVSTSCGEAIVERRQYNEATELWEAGNRYEATKLFAEDPSYKDSWDYIKKFYQTTGESVKVAMGRTAGLRVDGTVVDTRSNYAVQEWSNITQIASCTMDVLGLTDSGNVAIVEENPWTGEILAKGYLSGWNAVKSITSNGRMGFCALTESGTVLMDGRDKLSNLQELSGAASIVDSGEFIAGLMPDGTVKIAASESWEDCYKETNAWTDIVEISANGVYIAGLKADGTVVTVDRYSSNKRIEREVSEWTDIVSVCVAGDGEIVGLKKDGTLVMTGSKWDLSDWTNVVTVYADKEVIVALRSDGTVLAQGYLSGYLEEDEIAEWTDIVAVSVSITHIVGLKSNGTLVASGDNKYGQCNISAWKLFDNVNELFSSQNFRNNPLQNTRSVQDDQDTAERSSLVENFRYKVDELGNAEITGYVANEKMLIVPSEIDGHPVVSIRGFAERSNLESVYLPEGIKTIGEQAFRKCRNLREIDIPNSVTEIGDAAFEGCSNLLLTDIPEGVRIIGEAAFQGCENLVFATIPDGVERIEHFTFMDCTNLIGATIPDSVTYIGTNAFFGCKELSSVFMKEKYYDNVSVIGDGIFSCCSNLSYLEIEDPRIYYKLYQSGGFVGFQKDICCPALSVSFNGILYNLGSDNYTMIDSDGNPLRSE